MEAIVQATEEQLKTLQNMGVKIVCTENDAVIPSPFAHKAIQEEIRRYMRLFGSGAKAANPVKKLADAVIHRMEKALVADGSLSWEEVWEIIGACYSKVDCENGGASCLQQNSSAPTEWKSLFSNA